MLKIIKRILGCLIVLGGIIVIDKILVYVLVDDAENEIRYAMHEFYEQENIDSLFLGSSLVFCGYDPRILDEVWDENTYLAATPVQKIDGGYYLLKEAIKKNDIKTVYIDMFYRHFRDVPEERKEEHMEYIYCITDYMDNNWNRFEFLLTASGNDRYINSFFIPSRYGNHLLDIKRFERVIKAKRNDSYISYEKPDGFYKGAMFNPGSEGNPNLVGSLDKHNFAVIEEEIISQYSLDCLNKMVKLCKEEGIRLVLVATPITDLFIKAVGNYDVYYNYIKEYAKQNEIEYYDFNLCKKDILNFERKDFLDTIHLSGVGNEKYTKVFADIMLIDSKEDREKCFYSSVEEKMLDLEKQIFGVSYKTKETEENRYIFDIVSNYDVDVEYRFSIVDDENNDIEVIQEFGTNNELSVNGEIKKYKIIVRNISTKEICEEVFVDL